MTATYDAGSDKVILENTTPGDTSVINLGGSDDESNILSVLSVDEATQYTNGSGSTELTSTRHLGAISAADTLTDVSFAGRRNNVGHLFDQWHFDRH